MQIIDDRILRFDLDDIRVQVSAASSTRSTPSSPTALRSADVPPGGLGRVSQAEARLRTRLDAALRRVYGVRGSNRRCRRAPR